MADVATAFASGSGAAVVVEDLVIVDLYFEWADLIGVETGDTMVAGVVGGGEVADFEAAVFGDI